MRVFWKTLSITTSVLAIGSIFLSISMYYWPSIPSSPQPSEGRIYALNNHGRYTYMNYAEYRLRSEAWLIFVSSFAACAVIQHFVDPFGYKRK